MVELSGFSAPDPAALPGRRSEDDETTETEPRPCFQGETRAADIEVRQDDERVGDSVRPAPVPDQSTTTNSVILVFLVGRSSLLKLSGPVIVGPVKLIVNPIMFTIDDERDIPRTLDTFVSLARSGSQSNEVPFVAPPDLS